MTGWILALVALVVVVVVVALVRRRRAPDTVQSFQRQIDALGPAARRPVVDQVHRLEAEQRPEGRVRRRPVTPPVPVEPDEPADAARPTAPADPTVTGPDEEDERGA